MAKKRKPQGNKSRRGNADRQNPPLPDLRSTEGLLRDLVASLGGPGREDTPLNRAQEILNRAFQTPEPNRRIALAREALVVSPDCADAYVLLAENAPSRKQALAFYEQAVAAGERSLGPEAFQNMVGKFWLHLETRPYMRARAGLADALWTAGRRDEAIGHLQDMLRLNPGDNQGLRYTLAGYLLSEDRDPEVAQLLEAYPEEGSATWAYTRALLAFRQHGDTAESRDLLRIALHRNKHVPPYILGDKSPPLEQPEYYSPGQENEALVYIRMFLASWKAAVGSLAWLRANLPAKKKKGRKPPEPRGPLSMVKNWLNRNLPQQEEGWVVDFRKLPMWVQGVDGELHRPWMVVVVNPEAGLILGHEIIEVPPTPNHVWDGLVQAMQKPASGESYRPAALQVRPHELWDTLRPHLEEIGVEVVMDADTSGMDALFADMMKHLAGKDAHPGVVDMPGMTPEKVGSFYAAAADFYRAAPWRRVGYESAIKIQCDRFSGGPWYGVLMGQSGLTMGLAIYEDFQLLRMLWTQELSDEENARRTVATSVTFDEEVNLAVSDLDAAERYGWPVAHPNAYPSVIHKERGRSLRPPLVWELELLEGALRALPDFVKRHRQDDPTPVDLAVPTAGGELKLRLNWVVEEETEMKG